jgi:putative transposase
MTRFARIVIPSVPHHVIQRGNRRQKVFFRKSDYQYYLETLAHCSAMHGLSVWAYCLMPNHVHVIMEPESEKSLAIGVAKLHSRYTRMINFREKWRGYLWQGRFASFPMDDEYMLKCARYILLNPVRAKLVRRPSDWKWSSIHAHMKGEDEIVDTAKLGEWVDDWEEFIAEGIGEDELADLRSHARNCLPAGSGGFIDGIEELAGRNLRPGIPGRPKKRRRY